MKEARPFLFSRLDWKKVEKSNGVNQ